MSIAKQTSEAQWKNTVCTRGQHETDADRQPFSLHSLCLDDASPGFALLRDATRVQPVVVNRLRDAGSNDRLRTRTVSSYKRGEGQEDRPQVDHSARPLQSNCTHSPSHSSPTSQWSSLALSFSRLCPFLRSPLRSRAAAARPPAEPRAAAPSAR